MRRVSCDSAYKLGLAGFDNNLIFLKEKFWTSLIYLFSCPLLFQNYYDLFIRILLWLPWLWEKVYWYNFRMAFGNAIWFWLLNWHNRGDELQDFLRILTIWNHRDEFCSNSNTYCPYNQQQLTMKWSWITENDTAVQK